MTKPSNDPDILEKRWGGGYLKFFGLPFLLIGLGITVSGILLIVADSESPGSDNYFLLLFGLIFAVVGVCLVFTRGGWFLDRRKGEIRKWWGFLLPMRSKRHRLDQIEGVQLSRVKSLDSDYKYNYLVHMIGKSARKPILFEKTTSYEQACRSAERLSEFLRKPLKDISKDESWL